MARIWAISDTHGAHGMLNIPEHADILIHAGDGGIQRDPYLNEAGLRDTFTWMESLEHIADKLYVPGNHDTALAAGLIRPEEYPAIKFLIHESYEIHSGPTTLKFFGSPYTPTYGQGWSYMKDRYQLEPYWDEIPDDTDILITHGPPHGVLDLNIQDGFQCGCRALLRRVCEVRPMIHVFGHIHEMQGREMKLWDMRTRFINASMMDESYSPANNGIIL